MIQIMIVDSGIMVGFLICTVMGIKVQPQGPMHTIGTAGLMVSGCVMIALLVQFL